MAKNSDKIRLHKYVKQYLAEQGNHDYTSPEIQRNIEQYGVKIGKQIITNRLHWVHPPQKLDFDWPLRSHGDFDKIREIVKTEQYLVLYKPPGVVVQAGDGHMQDNLVNWLIKQYPEQAQFDTNATPTAGLAHRLDKLTQGVLLVARNPDTLQYFQDQFRQRKVVKKYLALVHGELTQRLHVKNYQSRSKVNPVRNVLFWSKEEATSYDDKSRFAESIFRPLFICRQTNRTIVEVHIKTGRMHQIRLQAQALNHALVQDPKYPKQQMSIPASAIASNQKFTTGVYKESSSEVHNIPEVEFSQLKESIFGGGKVPLERLVLKHAPLSRKR